MADNKYISPFVENGDQFRSADKTSYDLTNTSPVGGPINSPRYNYTHTYTPTNTYLDNFQGAASYNSAFGTSGDSILNGSIFEKTKLDVENPLPGDLGGPNRTNAVNIPNGTYTNNRSGNKYGESVGGPLKNKDGVIINNTVQQYTPKQTYLNEIGAESIIPNIRKSSTQIQPSSNPGELFVEIKKIAKDEGL